MRKKFLTLLSIITFIILCSLGAYKLVEFVYYKSSISNLKKYTFASNEKIVKTFEYNENNYVISMYYNDTSSWSHLGLLLKVKQNYYLLEDIKKCDTIEDGYNLYVLNNEIYIHCIGKEGNVDKYSIDNFYVKKETLNFYYKDTPNISQLHMGIDKVDNDFVYLSSPFKVDNTINDKPRVKCSFKDKKCSYY